MAMRRLAALTLLALTACSSAPRDADAYRTAIHDAYPGLDDTQLDELVNSGDQLCDLPDDDLPANARTLASGYEDDGNNLVPLWDATFEHYCPDRADAWHAASASLDPLR